jgi:hypothetical protein
MRLLRIAFTAGGLLVLATVAAAQTPSPAQNPPPKQPVRVVVPREPRPMLIEALIKREMVVEPRRKLLKLVDSQIRRLAD